MQPEISVIIPVYNGEKTIKESIESVLNQTFSSLEIIVINDGSTDSTLDIVKGINDSRLQVFSYPNTGVSASRNKGLFHSVGQFISFLDADDIWTPDKLESQLRLLIANKNATVAYSWIDYIDSDGHFLKAGRHATVKGDVYKHLLLWNFLENGSNPLIYREALISVGGFDESLASAEDWDIYLRLAAIYEFAVVPEVQILYRSSLNSLSTNLPRLESTSLKVIERAFSHEKAASMQHLKKRTIAYLYKYLTFKAVEADSKNNKRWLAVRFLWKFIINDPSIFKNQKLLLIALIKIIFPQIYYYLRKSLAKLES